MTPRFKIDIGGHVYERDYSAPDMPAWQRLGGEGFDPNEWGRLTDDQVAKWPNLIALATNRPVSDVATPLILRLTAEQLRKIADQLDAQTTLKHAGADHPAPNTPIAVDGEKLAYLHWWDSGNQFMAEVINFRPGADAPALRYHEGS